MFGHQSTQGITKAALLLPRHSIAARTCTGIAFLLVLVRSSAAAEPGPAQRVNVAADRHPISPYIYGINYADESLARELRLPVRRWGGNATTRYNWKNNMANRAADWYFENLPETSDDPANQPRVSAVNTFIEQNRRTATDSIITVPLIGWTPKDRPRSCGFSVAKYGPQQRTDPYWSDCGNGVKPDGRTNITGNDPHDTSVEIGADFVEEWVRYLVGRFGSASQGGVRFYNLDNEPMLWMYTHRDVHPQPTSYDEMDRQTRAYAAAIKRSDPDARTLGPVLWGWNAYFYSALDQVTDSRGNWTLADHAAHGGVHFTDWYLQQMRSYEQEYGTRILDYLDLHFYPQGSGVSSSDLGSAAVQELRLRSTRALWDPAYRDESWINSVVRLIPRMREWVENNYPGTKTAITEYNWGALAHLNGALAQADVLGIFGRERLDLATLWGPGTSGQPWAFAFRMYRNYDGAGSGFGETSVQATSADQGRLSMYAAERSADGALTLMVINKSATDLDSTIEIEGFSPAGTAGVFRYSAANLNAIVSEAALSLAGTRIGATFPAASVSLFVVPAKPAVQMPTTLTFAHVAAGGGYSTTFTLVNTGDAATTGRLVLTDQDGNPMNVSFAPTATGNGAPDFRSAAAEGSTRDVLLAPGASVTLTATSPQSAGPVAGWARLESLGGLPGGVASFRLSEDGTLRSAVGVLASRPIQSAVIPADNDDSRDRFTGFAVANPGAGDVHLTIQTLDEKGQVQDSIRPAELAPLGPGKQCARFLHQLLPNRLRFRGSMVISAGAGEAFVVVALTQDRGQFTAIPVVSRAQ